jgi:F-type H+-transporting ATPase subunit epsilon
MTTFLLEIITPQRQAFSEEVSGVYVPTVNGTIGILAHHQPLFTALSEGEIKIDSGAKEFFLAIGGGFLQITEKKVSILVSRAVHADELNETEIKKAEEAARKAIEGKAEGEELSQALASLRRSLLEMKVARRRKQRSGNGL